MSAPDANPPAGFAWYRPDQWSLLRAMADDGATLQASYEEWAKEASGMLWDLERKGIAVVKVEVDLRRLVQWCTREGRPLDRTARAEYANLLARTATAERRRAASAPAA